jgi:hypothetical protein
MRKLLSGNFIKIKIILSFNCSQMLKKPFPELPPLSLIIRHHSELYWRLQIPKFLD